MFMRRLRAVLSLIKDSFDVRQLKSRPRIDPLKQAQEMERRLVATLSRGNLSLQFGRYTTAKDIEDLRKSLRDHQFSLRG
ncbi:MAG: hypothetical protein HQL76_08825 [Magnetococcales bacterium]|nr:hypothetical protein [Magnetococcales bacterium]